MTWTDLHSWGVLEIHQNSGFEDIFVLQWKNLALTVESSFQ